MKQKIEFTLEFPMPHYMIWPITVIQANNELVVILLSNDAAVPDSISASYLVTRTISITADTNASEPLAVKWYVFATNTNVQENRYPDLSSITDIHQLSKLLIAHKNMRLPDTCSDAFLPSITENQDKYLKDNANTPFTVITALDQIPELSKVSDKLICSYEENEKPVHLNTGDQWPVDCSKIREKLIQNIHDFLTAQLSAKAQSNPFSFWDRSLSYIDKCTHRLLESVTSYPSDVVDNCPSYFTNNPISFKTLLRSAVCQQDEGLRIKGGSIVQQRPAFFAPAPNNNSLVESYKSNSLSAHN